MTSTPLLQWVGFAMKHLPPLKVAVSTNLEVLEAEVLQLAPADRSRLFERLIASIDTDSAVEQAWEFEADRLSPYG